MIIKVWVHPKSSQKRIEKLANRRYKVYVRSAPEDNKANEELVELSAKEFGVKKYNVEMIQGLTSRTKIVRIDTDLK